MMQPQSVVAVILAITVMLFMLTNTNLGWQLFGGSAPLAANAENVEAWLAITNVIIGGLIGYIAGKTGEK